MAGISSISRTELAQRRRALRRKRRILFFQRSWQTLAITTLAGSLLWLITLPPIWDIRKSEQIAIEGNEFLSNQAVRALLPLSYPQSLLKLQPQKLSEKLESQAPIAKATVIRQLFPPSLTIQVKERRPVAIARASNSNSQAKVSNLSEIGLLDINGVWMPLTSYTSLQSPMALPKLTIVGQKEHYRQYWTQLYQALRQSKVKITEIDWRDPANLILKTDLAPVHLGSYNPATLTEQLAMLSEMQQAENVKEKFASRQVDYIDLRDHTSPALVEPHHPVASHLPPE